MALEILLQPGLPAAHSLLQGPDHRLQQHLALVPPKPVHGNVPTTTTSVVSTKHLLHLLARLVHVVSDGVGKPVGLGPLGNQDVLLSSKSGSMQ